MCIIFIKYQFVLYLFKFMINLIQNNGGRHIVRKHLSDNSYVIAVILIALYARYLCSRDALGLYAAGRPSAARDDRVSYIQLIAGHLLLS